LDLGLGGGGCKFAREKAERKSVRERKSFKAIKKYQLKNSSLKIYINKVILLLRIIGEILNF
jgi:hypothetical protein